MEKRLKPRTNDVLKWRYIGTEVASAAIYKNGAVVTYTPSSSRDRATVDNERGIILDQSKASRLRSAFAFGYANCTWAALTTLTYLETPPAEMVKRHLDALRRAYRIRWGEGFCGWVMEFQRRGAVHFHLVHAAESNFGAACIASEKKWIEDAGKEPAEVVTGAPAKWMAGTWLKIIGKLGCEKSLYVARHRMVEMFRSPDAAGRYFAKDAAKKVQKELPEYYQGGLGRYWYLAKKWQPKLDMTVDLDLSRWPTDFPLKYVWGADEIGCAVSAMSFPDGTPESVVASARELFPPTNEEAMRPRMAEIRAQDDAADAINTPGWEGAHHVMPCECGALMWTNREGSQWGCVCGRTKAVTQRHIERDLPF